MNFIEKKYLAIKYLHFTDEEEFNAAMKEITILSKLQRYGNIVKLIGVPHIEYQDKEIYIVMECADKSLSKVIEENKHKVKYEHFLQIFSDLAYGLSHAHKNNCVHLDIKPGNVLLFQKQNRSKIKKIQKFNVDVPDFVYKLTDWGSGTSNNFGKTTRLKTGMTFTTAYAAPELLLDDKKVNFQKCDVFSLGMTMICCCGLSLNDIKHISSISKQQKFAAEIEEIIGTIDAEYGDTIKNLLRNMLKFEYHERIDIEKVVEILKNLGEKKEKKQEDAQPVEFIKISLPSSSVPENKRQEHAPDFSNAKPITNVPNYLNDNSRTALDRFGEFKYAKEEDKSLPYLEPYESENGAIYIGQWKNGLRHGRGKQYSKDGSIYEGEWFNDKINGKGRLIYGDGNVYLGDWLNEKAHGYGEYFHLDGGKYAGEWFEDKRHGKGYETWSDKASYEGQYQIGKRHGKGTYHWADGSIYEGNFSKNIIQGFGKFRWSDGRIYEGNWENYKMHGKGIYIWVDGQKYEGEYVNDRKEGYGIFEWPCGKKYKGNWINGKLHGPGMYVSSGGEEEKGEWLYGKWVKSILEDNIEN